MSALIGVEDTLKFVKMIKHGLNSAVSQKTESNENVFYPFYGHIDFSMISN